MFLIHILQAVILRPFIGQKNAFTKENYFTKVLATFR